MAGRWATYAASLGVFGVLGVSWLLRRSGLEGMSRTGRFALALVMATFFRALCQSFEVWGAEDALDWENLRAVALESRWGGRWRWQPISAMVVVVGFLATGRSRKFGTALAAVGLLGLAISLPMTGHAFGKSLAWPAQSVHVVGAGLWLGTLLVAMRLPVAERRKVLEAFAPLAAWGAALTFSSGAVLAYESLPSVSVLWTSGYGRVFSLKVALVLVVAGLGATNYRALRRRGHGLPATVGVEAAFAVLIIAVTGVLTSLAPPAATHEAAGVPAGRPPTLAASLPPTAAPSPPGQSR